MVIKVNKCPKCGGELVKRDGHKESSSPAIVCERCNSNFTVVFKEDGKSDRLTESVDELLDEITELEEMMESLFGSNEEKTISSDMDLVKKPKEKHGKTEQTDKGPEKVIGVLDTVISDMDVAIDMIANIIIDMNILKKSMCEYRLRMS